VSTSTEEYLEAIYNLSESGTPATTSAVAERLKVTPASATEMLRKLAADGSVNYAPYQGVTLTPRGLRIGEKTARKHRLLERFLHDTLKIGRDKVHTEACAMEHALSDEAERALCQTLKVPDHCPDDNKLIPPCNLDFPSCQECRKWGMEDFEAVRRREKGVVALSALKEGQQGTIAFIRGEDKVLQRLCALGLAPGAGVIVSRVAPFKGPVEIAVRGCKLALSDDIVSNVFVERPPETAND
jgi:DtxR family Mn-dependent transcriptional regulator